MPAKAKLSTRYSKKYKRKTSATTTATRLKYTVPEDAGINISDIQPSVDSIANAAVLGKAAPGVVVLVVKDGKVIYNKAYGAHTYDSSQATRITDIFDLASITKVSASTIATMRLYEQKKILLDSAFEHYIPSARNTSKSNLTIRNILLHQSGIAAGVGLPVCQRM